MSKRYFGAVGPEFGHSRALNPLLEAPWDTVRGWVVVFCQLVYPENPVACAALYAATPGPKLPQQGPTHKQPIVHSTLPSIMPAYEQLISTFIAIDTKGTA